MSQELLLEKWYRDVKVIDIFKGSGQAQRLSVARSPAAWQGRPGNIGYMTAQSGLVNSTGRLPTAPAGVQTRYPMDFTGQLPMRRLPVAPGLRGGSRVARLGESLMITGSNISVDGGATAKYWPWAPHARLRRSGTGDVRERKR